MSRRNWAARERRFHLGALQPMPLNAFIGQTMRELETDADEIAVGEAKGLVAAASPETCNRFSRG